MVNRRSFLQLLGISTVAPVIKIDADKCELCGKYGHKHEEGMVGSRTWVALNDAKEGEYVSVLVSSGQPPLTRWCKNAPVDWRFNERA